MTALAWLGIAATGCVLVTLGAAQMMRRVSARYPLLSEGGHPMSEPTAYEQAVQRFTAYIMGAQALVGAEQALRDLDTIRMELFRRQLAYDAHRRGVRPLHDDDPPEAA